MTFSIEERLMAKYDILQTPKENRAHGRPIPFAKFRQQ